MAVKKPAGLSSPYGQPSWHLQTRDRQASALFTVSSDPADVYETIAVVCGTATESAFVREAIFMTPTGPAGAVFLPSAGYREGNEVTLAWENYPEGCYWTSTIGNDDPETTGRVFRFRKASTEPEYSIETQTAYRHYGFSVRLIGPWIDD